jgi:predicted esterase
LAPPPLPTPGQPKRHRGGRYFVYPPLEPTAARASLILMLHGMCSDALATCDFWSRAGREGSFLLCPEGNGRCGDRPDWQGTGEDKAYFLDGVIAAARAAYGPHLAAPGRDILIGFSRGAFVARDVAYARPGRYRGLILIGAALRPDPERLRASGIRRVVLAAGDYDGARPTMQLAAAELDAAGLTSLYVSTGKIWHQLPADLEQILRAAIRWIDEAPP